MTPLGRDSWHTVPWGRTGGRSLYIGLAGLLLLAWWPWYEATALAVCGRFGGVGTLGFASVALGGLLVGWAVASAFVTSTWALVVVTLAVAIVDGVADLVIFLAIGFNRCWTF